MVEAVQHRATKIITQLKNKPYVERLKTLKLPSLVYQRRRGDMINMYKIKNGLVRLDSTKLFSPLKTYITRGHNQRIFKNCVTKTARKKSFSQRVVNNWNSLSSHVISSPTLNTFKERLDIFWKNHHYDVE